MPGGMSEMFTFAETDGVQVALSFTVLFFLSVLFFSEHRETPPLCAVASQTGE